MVNILHCIVVYLLPSQINDFLYEYESSFTLREELLHFYIAPVDKTNAFVLVISDYSSGNETHPCFCYLQASN